MARTSDTKPNSDRDFNQDSIWGPIRNSAWPFVMVVFLASRVFFLGVGALAATFLPAAEPAGFPLEPPGFLNYWAHWDGGWYSEIATEGYVARAPASTAFFPLYPLLVRVGTALGGGPALWGVLISLLATLFALYFLYGIAEKLFDPRVARSSTLALAFFPTTFFLNAVYTEALFLALTTGSVWVAYVRRSFLLAGLLGGLAAATRNLGVLLLIPLFVEWNRTWRVAGGRGLAALGLIPAGLAAYGVFLWLRFGDPMISARQQGDYWGRTLTSPVSTFRNAWSAAGDGLKYLSDPQALFLSPLAGPALEASNTLNLLFLGLFLMLIAAGFALLPVELSLYTFVVMVLPLLTPGPLFPLMSLPRFMVGTFPLFLVLGYLLTRSRPAFVVWMVFSVLAGAALTALFVTWRWVA